MKVELILPPRVYKLWRRAWGENWLQQEARILRAKRFPWSMICWIIGHDWGDKSPTVIVGPLGVPPRERHYHILGFQRQCERCYVVDNVSYTVEEKLAAIEDEIRSDEQEWPAIKKYLAEKRNDC